MDVYRITFGALVVASAGLAYSQWKKDNDAVRSKEGGSETVEMAGAALRFKKTFIPVYLLVMASDWLQGPYVYTLYKDQYGLAEPVVAMLFAAGFVAAAVSATFVGSLADKHGRRLACMVFCVTYALSCLTKLFNDVIMLFIGRLLGGVATTLMYSVFESWMVTEYYAQDLDKSGMSLDSMFGLMTTLNGAVAILSGVVGEAVVSVTKTKTSPFMVAVVLLAAAAWLMHRNWSENYGDSATLPSDIPEKSALKIMFRDKRILVLGFVCCVFEGSMYLMVFFWSAALKSAHAYSWPNTTDASAIPFGLIFATFMASMMLGSIAFSRASSNKAAKGKGAHFGPAHFLTLAIAGAAISLLVTVMIKSENLTFWAFCLFEACIGVYFPSMGAQRGRIIEDGVRAKVYGILRIPLNVFVVGMLILTKEGDAHRDRVFVFCGGLLLVAVVAAGLYLEDTPEPEIYTIAAEEGIDRDDGSRHGSGRSSSETATSR